MKKYLTEANFNLVMATAVLLVLAIPVGIANLYLGYVVGEGPCTLCGHERFGMVLVGILGVFMLRYGPKIKYLASVFIVAFYGLYTAMRHVGNHAWRDVGMGFGDAIFGVHTYTWALFVYWVIVLAMALLMFFIRRDNDLSKDVSGERQVIKELRPYAKFVVILSFVIMVSNSFQMLMVNGLPPYAGTGYPPRFTLDISRAVSMWDRHDMYERFFEGNGSLLGRNSVPRPHIPGVNELDRAFNNDPLAGPVENLKEPLKLLAHKDLPFPVVGTFHKGNAAGIAYDKESGEFGFVSTDGGLYFVDEALEKVTGRVILDRPNGNDIRLSTDATFLGKDQLVGVAFNKIMYGVKRVDSAKVNSKLEWKSFRETSGGIMPLFGEDRPYLTTMRAREAFVLSIAKDPASSYVYMLSIPNHRSKRTILIKHDTTDNLLSEESILKPSDKLTLKEKRNIDEFYITSADIRDGKLFALSKQFNSLLQIDLASKTLEVVYPLPDMGDAHGLAIRDDSLFVLSRIEGKDRVYELALPHIEE
ncbi:MAG: disulfide bond formation protein B [Wolinella sp.]